MQKTESDRLACFRDGNRNVFLFLALLCVLLWTTGCGKTAQKEETGLKPPGPTAASPTDKPPVLPPVVQVDPTKIVPEEGLTSDKLLRRMLETYAKAKYYSDDAYVESLYEITLDGRKKIAYQRCPGSVIFEKPNLIRMAVNDGLLISDGKTLRGRILLPAYHSEYAQWPAPLLISSIGELYLDARLAHAMGLGTPDNIFWAPPQLILLLSKNPLKTFLPDGSSSVLLDPALLIRKNPR
ncbi:MAG: hypothetical protein Q4G59_11310, partial [Planctomycetia bacterium]|nr:hypothetical protein [Planctomycetia bacterium]